MRFESAVRNQEIAWPTQKSFDRNKWLERAEELSEDQHDHDLADAGIWVADVLGSIREMAEETNVRGIPYDTFARGILAMCNHDLSLAQCQGLQIASELDATPAQFMDEIILEELGHNQDFFGARTVSSHLESGLDSAQLNLSFHSGAATRYRPVTARDMRGIRLALNTGVLYLAAMDCFYRTLYLDWCIREQDNAWFVGPRDEETERKWAASSKRFNALLSQFACAMIQLWRGHGQSFWTFFDRKKRFPQFALKRTRNLIRVRFVGYTDTVPDIPPAWVIGEAVARELYYEPLLEEPLPKLNGRNVLGLLRMQFLVQDIARMVLEQFPQDYDIRTYEKLVRYCPIIHQESLVAALSQASGSDENEVSLLLEALVWDRSSSDSIWFHPLVPFETDRDQGLLFVFLPILAGNIYRTVDYWLAKFGLPLEKRGQLFEQQVVDEVKLHAKAGSLEEHVVVRGPVSLSSGDKTSREQIDTLILLHNLVVVGEVKCQRYPASQLERYNYLNTLRAGADQAKRKAQWVRQNLDAVARVLGVTQDSLSGEVLSVVITNHALGVGMSLNDVPVLDSMLLTNYLSQPYPLSAFLTSDGLLKHRGEAFYENAQGMAEAFTAYATAPPSIRFYHSMLQPILIDYPFRLRGGGNTYMLDYVMGDPKEILQKSGKTASRGTSTG